MALSSPLLPVSLVLAGRRCLLVAGGPAAAARARALLGAGAELTVVAEQPDDELAALPCRLERRAYRPGEAGGYFLVVSASESSELNAAVLRDGDAAGVFVNAVDDLEHSSVHFPAVGRFGPVSVAVSSGATSPALARWARDEVEALLGAEIAFLAEVLGPLRAELRARGHSSEGRDWPGLIAELRALRDAGDEERARARAADWLAAEVGRDRP